MNTPEISPEGITFTEGFVYNIRNLGSIYFLILRRITDSAHFKEEDMTTQYVTKDKALISKLSELKRNSFVSVKQGPLEKEGPTLKSQKSYILLDVQVKNAPKVDILDDAYKNSRENVLEKSFRFLSLKTYDAHKILVARSAINKAIREYYQNLRYIEINTPKLLENYSQGGSELFEVRAPETPGSQKYYLSQSPQLNKQIAINMGVEGVYEITPYYRAQRFKTTRHLNEPLCVDMECVNRGLSACMQNLKNLLVYISESLEKDFSVVPLKSSDFTTITYENALDLLNQPFGYELTTKEESRICQILEKKMVFITAYPSAQKPFYNKEGKNFDLVCSAGELSSGGQREEDLTTLKHQLQIKKIPLGALQDYLDSFKYGLTGSMGWGLGLDRVMKYLFDYPSIRNTKIFANF